MLRKIIWSLPLKWQIKIKSYYRLGYIVDTDTPITFNEKINFRKLFWKNNLFVDCADKVKVRDYVREKIGSDFLIPALKLGAAFEINDVKNAFSELGPGVLKANHNSGPVQFIEDNEEFKLVNSVIEIKNQLRNIYGLNNQEVWYRRIKPDALYEKKLITEEGEIPVDYKFHVFNQNRNEPVIILQIDYDRFHSHSRVYYDRSFKKLPFSVQYHKGEKDFVKPLNYKTMLEVARTLSAPFSYCRVDLYNVSGKIYFGEITFASDGGYGRFSDKKYDKLMGDYWVIDPRI